MLRLQRKGLGERNDVLTPIKGERKPKQGAKMREGRERVKRGSKGKGYGWNGSR